MTVMFLVPFFGTLLVTLGSCSIIDGTHVFPEIIEQSSASLNTVNQGDFIKDRIREELQEYHNHMMGKLEFLSAACKPSSSSSDGIFLYNVSTDAFRDPRINILVKVMSRKMQEIAEITMDDLNQKLEHFKLLVTQLILNKFSPLLSDIAELQNQVKSLATKRAFAQIEPDVTSVLLSRSDEVSIYLSSLSTKSDFITRSSRLIDLSEAIRRKIETLKLGESSAVKESALKMSNKLKGELAIIEDMLRTVSLTMDDAASENAKGLLQEILTRAKANGKVVTASSALVMEMRRAYTNRLSLLNLNMEETATRVHEYSCSSVPQENEEITSTEQIHHLTGNVDGSVTTRPCLDSRFIGHGRSLNICAAAVRLRKCYMQIVAFHCCRSCMDAGLISAAPSMTASRNLSALKALTFLRPT